MKRFAIACTAVLGLMFAGSTIAEAGGYGFGGYYGGFGRYGGYGYGYRSPSIWHDTSHYHYHPGQYVRHYNHYHYLPGHYDLHQTGHYDTFHGNHIHHHGH
jgi:hypothetical protein